MLLFAALFFHCVSLWLSVSIHRIGRNSFSLFYFWQICFMTVFCVAFRERPFNRSDNHWQWAFFWRFFQCRCCYCRRHIFLSFRSSHLPLAVLRSTKCVWFFWFTVRTFRAAGNLHREIFFSFVRIITFFYDLFRLWVCVWTECFTRKKWEKEKINQQSFRIVASRFICRHAVRSIENSGKEQEIVSLHDTKTHQLIAFSLSLIAHTHTFSDRMAKGVRNIYIWLSLESYLRWLLHRNDSCSMLIYKSFFRFRDTGSLWWAWNHIWVQRFSAKTIAHSKWIDCFAAINVNWSALATRILIGTVQMVNRWTKT